MNIKDIKASIIDDLEIDIDDELTVSEVVSKVVDALCDELFNEGKISDVMINHGRTRSKKMLHKKRSELCPTSRKRKR